MTHLEIYKEYDQDKIVNVYDIYDDKQIKDLFLKILDNEIDIKKLRILKLSNDWYGERTQKLEGRIQEAKKDLDNLREQKDLIEKE